MLVTGQIAPGSIVEISLIDGFGYVQVSHLHNIYQEVLKVCTKSFAEPLPDPQVLAFEKVCLFPLSAAIVSGQLQGSVVAPDRRRETESLNKTPFPLFKFAVRNEQGEALYWWLWDGEQIELAAEDTDYNNLPVRRVLMVDEFREMFEMNGGLGWLDPAQISRPQ